MNATLYNILLYAIYGVMILCSIVLIFFVAFMMRSKGNGLSAISNSNLALFETTKSYGVEKGMQRVCTVCTLLMFCAVVGYLVVLKIGTV